MAAYGRVCDSHHLQADCREPGSAPDRMLCNRVWATFTFFSICWTLVTAHCSVLQQSGHVAMQGEWKLVALSAPYRLRRPDRRFEELKNYSSELQTHINNIIKIRTVCTAASVSRLSLIPLCYWAVWFILIALQKWGTCTTAAATTV